MCSKLACFVVALLFAIGNGNTVASGDNQNQFHNKMSDRQRLGIPEYSNELYYRTQRRVFQEKSSDGIGLSNIHNDETRMQRVGAIHSLFRKKRQFDGGWNWADPNDGGNSFGPSTQNPTGSVEIPGMGTRRPPCEDNCQGTPQYNPVCGSDDVTYFSMWRFRCAQQCGKRIAIKHLGACSKIPPRG